jgi:hypothetical protein
MDNQEFSTSLLEPVPAAGTGSLVDLPEPCLLMVLRCLADDQISLCSAARAHSRLHQAAVTVLHSITAVIEQQQQADSVLVYFSKHGQHIDSISLKGDFSKWRRSTARVSLRQLPPIPQLHTLELDSVRVQLQPRGGFPGVLDSLPALKQLQLSGCKLLDSTSSDDWPTLPVGLLPTGLEHLTVRGMLNDSFRDVHVPAVALHGLEQLAYLELHGEQYVAPVRPGEDLQPVQLEGNGAHILSAWGAFGGLDVAHGLNALHAPDEVGEALPCKPWHAAGM